MSVRTLKRTDGATFYCTFTCWQWLPLIERTSTYDHIYNWMHIAKAKSLFGISSNSSSGLFSAHASPENDPVDTATR